MTTVHSGALGVAGGGYRSDSAIEPVMLKILRDDLGETVVFRIRSEVRIEPA